MATTILLVDLPPMMEDMVAGLLNDRPELQVVRRPSSDKSFIDAATDAGAPIVVISRRDPVDLAAIEPYLAKAANVSVVAVATDGGSACLHAFRPTGRRMEDVSAQQLLDAILADVHRAL